MRFSGVPRIFFGGGGGGGPTNSVENRGQRDRRSGDGSSLVRGYTQFANEWNPYSDYVVTDVFSTEVGIRLSFVKTSFFFLGGGGGWTPNPPRGTPLAGFTKNSDNKMNCHIGRSNVLRHITSISKCVLTFSSDIHPLLRKRVSTLNHHKYLNFCFIGRVWSDILVWQPRVLHYVDEAMLY
jgi:hypothetical protein